MDHSIRLVVHFLGNSYEFVCLLSKQTIHRHQYVCQSIKYVLGVYNFALAISSLKMCGCLGHFPSLLDTIQNLTTQFVLYAVALAFITYHLYLQVSSTTAVFFKVRLEVLSWKKTQLTYQSSSFLKRDEKSSWNNLNWDYPKMQLIARLVNFTIFCNSFHHFQLAKVKDRLQCSDQ